MANPSDCVWCVCPCGWVTLVTRGKHIPQRVTGALNMSLPVHIPFQEKASCHVLTHKLHNKVLKNTSFHTSSGISGWKMNF